MSSVCHPQTPDNEDCLSDPGRPLSQHMKSGWKDILLDCVCAHRHFMSVFHSTVPCFHHLSKYDEERPGKLEGWPGPPMTVQHVGAQEMNPKVKPQITKFLRPLIRLSLTAFSPWSEGPLPSKGNSENQMVPATLTIFPGRSRAHYSDPWYDGGAQDTCPRDTG